MIKILYALNGSFAKGGTEAVVMNYYNNIDKSKFQIDFLLHVDSTDCLDDEIYTYLRDQGSKIFCVTPRGTSYRKNKLEMNLIIQKHKYDIVHSHMDVAGAFFLASAKKNGVKIRVSHSHNTSNQLVVRDLKSFTHSLILFYAKLKLRYLATHLIACSREAGIWLYGKKNYEKKRIRILNNAIDTQKFKYSESIRNSIRTQLGLKDEFIIGHIGRFETQKNHIFLIDIFEEIVKKEPSAFLILIGTGSLESTIINYVKSKQLSDRVLFYGTTNASNEMFQIFDVFALPSLFEGLPVVAIEAQAAGLKCIVSDTISKDVKLTDNLEFVHLESSTQVWAKKILEYKDGYFRNDVSLEIASKGYDIKTNATVLSQFYEDCIRYVRCN